MVIAPDGYVVWSLRGRGVVQGVFGASEDLLRNIHGVATVAELDGDEIGFLVGRVAESVTSVVIENIRQICDGKETQTTWRGWTH